MLALCDAAAHGMGLAVLPCYLGDGARGLVRVGALLPGLASELWLLQHPDLRRTERVRAFAEAMRAGFAALQPRLDGAA